jgi:hypothetical protein
MYLNELDVRKPLGVTFIQESEDAGVWLYNLV